MKSKLLFLLVFLYTFSLEAKEGMWLPFLLEKMNEKEMRQMGLKIRASDIYDVNEGSLKDAVVIFGGGCTGEVISDKGLVLTNHHCGYGTVQGLSSLQNNYLLDGFFAKSQQEEIPCPGLSVTFIVRIDDVTETMREGFTEGMADSTRNRLLTERAAKLEKETKEKTGYDATVKSFFYDNEYYLFLMEKFNDIRLVSFPPNGIGKFGGDTDNWAWPRHTGDFGLFRIYANKENKPAAYSSENIPFVPRRSMKINIGGVEEGDFTWVYGFPGRTSEYLTSDGVAEVMNVLDPARIKIREKRLDIMDKDMAESKEIFIKYAAKQAGIANYYKKWKGELQGLQINDAIAKKKAQEGEFLAWMNEEEERQRKYNGILDSIRSCYRVHEKSMALNEYLNEAIWSSEMLKKGSMLSTMLKALDTLKTADSLAIFQREVDQFFKSIDVNTDKKITQALFAIYNKDMGANEYTGENMINAYYSYSVLSNPTAFSDLLFMEDISDIRNAILRDPLYQAYYYFDSVQKSNLKFLRKSLTKMNKHYGKYILALKEFNEGKQFYPDANSTLRVSYGKVEGLKPADGMSYSYYTTLDGAVRKHNPAKEEFTMPQRLLDLHKAKDYGRYSIRVDDEETVPLAFLASNHTTGGNSGSPVLNANGELIGTNFDRIWEGTMSDIMYDINLCRNITLDIRYTLFIIEKFGQAKWVIDELNLVN
jgi:hypothetical protein